MKILLVIDTKSQNRKEIIQDAWNKFLADYLETSLKIEREDVYEDFSITPWVEYRYLDYKNLYGLDTGWVRNFCNKIWNKENGKYDLIILAVDETNWKEPNGAWGWNLGQWFNDYQVQIVRVSPYLDLGFKMEVLHALDQFILQELGINLNKFFNVQNFDEDIVHGRLTNYQNVYENYKGYINQIGDLLVRTFDKRRNKWQQVLILKTLLELYIKLINLFRKREDTPLFKEGVEHKHLEKYNMKPFYQSRTLWVNALAAVALFLQQQYGFVLSVELQGIILIVLNILLRFDTKTSIR